MKGLDYKKILSNQKLMTLNLNEFLKYNIFNKDRI